MKNDNLFVNQQFNFADFQTALKNQFNRKFVLVDENSKQNCLNKLLKKANNEEFIIIEIPSGEENKSIETVAQIWQKLIDNQATRSSVLINLGGGVICDIGGFAAATFKRGIEFVNIPTTLLAAVDAAFGGKNGVNFSNLKNEIGTFRQPYAVFIASEFFETLDIKQLKSGFAEMLKHSLLDSLQHFNLLLSLNISDKNFIHNIQFNKALELSINLKSRIVETDPYEKNQRKALNLGHTFAHALESLYFEHQQQILHGQAVAYGLLFELYISNKKLSFDTETLNQIKEFIFSHFQPCKLTTADFENILNYMKHDKKNFSQQINFTLLEKIGNYKVNETANSEILKDAFNFILM